MLTRIPPLDLQREERLAQLWLRLVHNPKNPTKNAYKKPIKTTSQKTLKEPIINQTRKLLKEIGIKESDITKYKPGCTWTHDKLKIDNSLKNKISKKRTDLTTMQTLTKELIDNKYKDHIKVYTDGSKKDNLVGAGFHCEADNTSNHFRLTDETAIMSAELAAIDKGLLHIKTYHKNEKVALISDSLSSLQNLENPINKKAARPDLNANIHLKNDKLNNNVTYVWAPSHIGLDGNELADSAANLGTLKKEVDLNIKLGVKEAKNKIKKHFKNKFNNLWKSCEVAHRTKELFPNIPANADISFQEMKLNRLRLNAPYFYIPHEEKHCELCNSDLTPKHVLEDCYHFINERHLVEKEFEKTNKHFNSFNILDPKLKGDAKIQVKNLVNAINKIFPV